MDWKQIFNKREFTSLDDVRQILKDLHFKKTFKIINVVGTNGKGSVSNYLFQALVNNGFKVGLFTSPHLFSPRERIVVNNELITDFQMENIYKLMPSNLHFFAYMFIIALKHFEQTNCDFAIIEAGIGGQKDTTNAINGDYALVTSIGQDHVELLGKSLTDIALNKAGIINENMHVIIPSSLEEKLQNIFIEQANKQNAYEQIVDNKAINYHMQNQKLAHQALKIWFKINFNNFVTLPGRSEQRSINGFKAFLDVAHNYDGIIQALNVIGDNYQQVVLCFKKSKNIKKILPLFKNKKIYYYQPTSEFYDLTMFTKIKNIGHFYHNQKTNTLYIGSFYLIGDLPVK